MSLMVRIFLSFASRPCSLVISSYRDIRENALCRLVSNISSHAPLGSETTYFLHIEKTRVFVTLPTKIHTFRDTSYFTCTLYMPSLHVKKIIISHSCALFEAFSPMINPKTHTIGLSDPIKILFTLYIKEEKRRILFHNLTIHFLKLQIYI